MRHFRNFLGGLFLVFCSCASKTTPRENTALVLPEPRSSAAHQVRPETSKDSLVRVSVAATSESVPDTTLVNLKDLSQDFVYQIKYATTDNFLKTQVYDCAACYLRLKTAQALIKANERFLKKGYRIVLYDCYRPWEIQKKMWELVPNPSYVADPAKGSIHNRGGAVDISLVDANGNELDMGTAFDHFGPEAAHDYPNLTEQVITNRKLLRQIMTRSGFRIFESEWWHYNLKNARREPIANFKWNCD